MFIIFENSFIHENSILVIIILNQNLILIDIFKSLGYAHIMIPLSLS